MSGEVHSERLCDIGEEQLVERLITRLSSGSDVVVGPGDDCAVVETGGEHYQLLKTDCLVEGVHFECGTDPRLVGRKAMNRALSDIAAMGGRPMHGLVTIATGGQREVSEVEGWYAGLVEAGKEWGCDIVGGETTSLGAEGAVLSVSLTGVVHPSHCVCRSGASPGDAIVVCGKLGGSFESGRHLHFTPRLREALWLVENADCSAMMDLSDGLGSDLPRLAEASGVGYEVDFSLVPCHEGVSVEQAISEGEDYELLLTMKREAFERTLPEWEHAFPNCDLTRIGDITTASITELPRGWEHYQEP